MRRAIREILNKAVGRQEKQPVSPHLIDNLIRAMSESEPAGEGVEHLAKKLDHLIHAMRLSGHLAGLSKGQVNAILYALREAGHKNVTPLEDATYNQDGLASIHNADFLQDARFVQAYQRGIAAAGTDSHWHWRVHVGLWAACHAAHLAGDFIECGVNRGFLSSAIMQYLDWNSLGKRFFLLDTFKGLDETFISDEERRLGKTASFNEYTECYDDALRNFAEFQHVTLIRGAVPTTLPLVDTNAVSYLHIDMNCVMPEIAAIAHFWDRLVPAAVVLLDDYACRGYEPQKRGMDEFATQTGVHILSLPTSQGLVLKPH
jgi:hypothetical protein